MPKPRVLLLTGLFLSGEGITSHLITLSKALMKYGWEVALASPMVDEADEGELSESKSNVKGLRLFHIPFPTPRISIENLALTFKTLQKLDAVIRQFKPDIIHSHAISICPYIHAIRPLHNISFVTTCHVEIKTRLYRFDVKYGALVSNFFKSFPGHRVIAISSELKDEFKHIMKVPEDNIRLIYHGIDHEHFRPPSLEERLEARALFNLPPHSKVICHIGRLSPVKGHEILIQALSILRSEGIDAIVLCAGKGTEKREATIRGYAAEMGVSDLVHLLGFTDPRQVLWASDVITLPSQWEGFALVIPEAMLCGVVPIRTPAAGALDQIEDGVNGFIIPFDDPEALALRLKQVLENEPFRTQMATSTLESAKQRFTADRMAKDTIAVYKEVINERKTLISETSWT